MKSEIQISEIAINIFQDYMDITTYKEHCEGKRCFIPGLSVGEFKASVRGKSLTFENCLSPELTEMIMKEVKQKILEMME